MFSLEVVRERGAAWSHEHSAERRGCGVRDGTAVGWGKFQLFKRRSLNLWL